jgi:UDP-glucuronate decarboxylase
MDIDDGRVITNFIKNILEDKPAIIYGDGTQTRSFCYVDDMIDGLYKMMNSKELGPINLGNPNCEFSLNELVNVFEEILYKKVNVRYVEATENDPKQRKPIIDKATKLLNWYPKIGLENGLMQTYQYFKNIH